MTHPLQGTPFQGAVMGYRWPLTQVIRGLGKALRRNTLSYSRSLNGKIQGQICTVLEETALTRGQIRKPTSLCHLATPDACREAPILSFLKCRGAHAVIEAPLSHHMSGMRKRDATQMKRRGHNPHRWIGSAFFKHRQWDVPLSVNPTRSDGLALQFPCMYCLVPRSQPAGLAPILSPR